MTTDLEGLLRAFRRHNPCCKSATVRLETVHLTGEPPCLTQIAGFFHAHDLPVRRTAAGLELSVSDLEAAVALYDEP
jgi:hypothetical protein